jgi:hypothetical protein
MKDEMSFARFRLKHSHVKFGLQNYEQGKKYLCHRKYNEEGLQWIMGFICSLPLFTTFMILVKFICLKTNPIYKNQKQKRYY